MKNVNRPVKELLEEEITLVDSYRRENNLPTQGEIEYTTMQDSTELDSSCLEFNDANGTFTLLASSRTNTYLFIEEDFRTSAMNDGQTFDVQGFDKDNTGNGSLRHRGLRL